MKKATLLIAIVLFIFFQTTIHAQTITLTTCNWEPYLGEKLENNGYFAEIVTEAFKASGYKLKIVFLPWKRAVVLGTDAKNGIDGLIGNYYSKERDKVLFFSDPIIQAKTVFLKKKGKEFDFGKKYSTLKDLKGHKIGVLRGAKFDEEFDAADYLTKEETNSIEQCLKKLMLGRVDLVVENYANAFFVIKNKLPEFSGKIEVVEPPLSTNHLYITISKKVKGGDEIISKFNSGLMEIKNNALFDKILIKHGMK